MRLFLDNFNPAESLKEKGNFRCLLNLEWLVYDFIHVRLRLHPKWRGKKYFLDLFDIDKVLIKDGAVYLTGDIVWWAEGDDAAGEWWPADHEPHWVGVYKVKMRGDLSGGYWVIEPVFARLRQAKTPKRNAEYEIEFGTGSTYMKIKSC